MSEIEEAERIGDTRAERDDSATTENHSLVQHAFGPFKDLIPANSTWFSEKECRLDDLK